MKRHPIGRRPTQRDRRAGVAAAAGAAAAAHTTVAALIALAATMLFAAGCSDAGAGGGVADDAGGTDIPAAAAHGEGVAADSALVSGWATGVVAYGPGAEAAAYTDARAALGPATGVSTEVVTLGRGGTITLELAAACADRDGAELAVFENALGEASSLFAELAYVEVSSNGTDFARFPVATTRTEPVGAYGRIDTGQYSGFAGLHPAGTGTAFDLAELRGSAEVAEGPVDLDAVRFVRLVDVVGDGRETDASGTPVYDPYPTTDTAGFDLDGVALLRGGE